MGGQGWLVERFEQDRPRLRGVAYRMLGSLSEADDAVQEAWLRLNHVDAATIENLRGWLTTVVSRVCLDMLRGRRLRREQAIGEEVPEPRVTRGEGADPESEALLADSVGVALLVILDTLGPAERLAFVLHDLFAMPFDEIGSIIGRSPAAAKQLASRARRRVRGSPARSNAGRVRQREVVDAFLRAVRGGTSRLFSPCSIPMPCFASTLPPVSMASFASMPQQRTPANRESSGAHRRGRHN
jgi:RNA polymerase sigma factor (sigma-70 family)